MKAWNKFLVSFIILVFAVSIMIFPYSYADNSNMPMSYVFTYKGSSGGDVVEVLGADYVIAVTGSVSLEGKTTQYQIKLRNGEIHLPMDVYEVVSDGAYSFTIDGYFDKTILNGEITVSSSGQEIFDLQAFDGVIYVYVSYSNDPIQLKLQDSAGNILGDVTGHDGYALLTKEVEAGNYKVIFSTSGQSTVNYTIAYSQRDSYSVGKDGIYKTKVVCVASCGLDGDTVRVRIGGENVKVRLIGVNTPEIAHGGDSAECYGNEARQFTDAGLNGKWIYLEFDKELFDKYDRYLAYVWLTYPNMGDPTEYMWNAILAKEGYAKLLLLMPNVKYGWLLSRLVYNARHSEKGLWGVCNN